MDNQNKNHDNSIGKFLSDHQTGIVTSIVLVSIVGLGILSIKTCLNSTSYLRWLEKIPLDDLKKERDRIHELYMNHTTNDDYRIDLWNLLNRIDKRISVLTWEGKPLPGLGYSREDGRNLYRPE